MLRQGEDRKTTVEETRLLDIKVKEVKQAQKKQRDQYHRLTRNFYEIEQEMRKQTLYVEKIRQGQDRVHSTHSACRARDREYVTQD